MHIVRMVIISAYLYKNLIPRVLNWLVINYIFGVLRVLIVSFHIGLQLSTQNELSLIQI